MNYGNEVWENSSILVCQQIISIVIEMIVVRIAELEKDIFLELELHKILEQELELWLLDR